jgi:hypothetical protein
MTATASGLQVPPVPSVDPAAAVTAHAGDTTLTIADCGVNLTNTGAVGTAIYTLLAAAAAAGMALRVFLTVAQIVQLKPATGEKIYLAGDGTADDLLNIADVIGNYVDLFCDGEKYLVQDYSGVVTKVAP